MLSLGKLLHGVRRDKILIGFTAMKYFQKQSKPVTPAKKLVKGKDMYFKQALSNFVECLNENLRQTKFKAFSQLKSSAIMMTHQ